MCTAKFHIHTRGKIIVLYIVIFIFWIANSKMRYQDKITQQVFHRNFAFGATRNVTSRVLGWQECAPDNSGSVKKFYLKREENICEVSCQTFLCKIIKSLWIEQMFMFSSFIIMC